MTPNKNNDLTKKKGFSTERSYEFFLGINDGMTEGEYNESALIKRLMVLHVLKPGMCYGRIGSNFLSLNPCAKPLKSYGVLNRCCSGV